MSGGPRRDQRFTQRRARTLEIGAVGFALDDHFDGEGIHGVHKS